MVVGVIAASLVLHLAGCGSGTSEVQPLPSLANRLTIAVLPFTMGVEITSLSSLQTVNGDIEPQEEPRLVAQAVNRVRAEARQLLFTRLAQKHVYGLVPLEETDRALDELGIAATERLSPEQQHRLRLRLGADLLVTGVVLDYGKVRWQWLAGGMLADIAWESVVLGLATSWNPAAIFGNVGFELLTSTPLWFGGGYLFGVAFRPVRAQVTAIDPVDGAVVWRETEVAIYIRRRLTEVPEEDRKKKEVQLRLNLATAIVELADSLADAALTRADLRVRRLPDEQTVSF